MEKLSIFITKWFINKNLLPEEDEELYAYAVNCFLISASPLLLIIIFGACLNLIWEGIILIIPFITIRSFSGGIHSKTPGKCFLISTGILLTMLILTKMISNSNLLSVILLGASISLIFHSPIESENKPLNTIEKKTYKKITTVCTIIFVSIYLIMGYMKLNTFAVSIALGVILTASLQIPCLIFKPD